MSLKKGLIVKSISGEYTVDIGEEYIICKPRGVFRYDGKTPKVGDKVEIDVQTRTITNIFDRHNDLIRPFMSNIDKVFLVFSVVEPDLNLNLLDKMISIIEYQDIEINLVFSKLDLLKNKTEYDTIKKYYQKIGYKVFESDNENFLNDILQVIDNSVCAVTGQSGVGKSTIINNIEPSLNIKTAEISYALNRGKHTTRHIELIKVGNGYVADTPGFGIADFEDIDLLTLSHSFKEFYENSSFCKYPQCTHINEPRCKIKELVEKKEILKSRYDNYLLFANEVKEKQRNKY